MSRTCAQFQTASDNAAPAAAATANAFPACGSSDRREVQRSVRRRGETGPAPEKKGVLHDRRRRNASTSLTLREQFCAGRAATLTRRKSDLLKFPWGNPREAQPGPKAQSKPSLEHSTARQQYSSFVYAARAPPAKNQPWLRNGRSGITGKGPASEVAEKRPTRAPPWKSGPSRT